MSEQIQTIQDIQERIAYINNIVRNPAVAEQLNIINVKFAHLSTFIDEQETRGRPADTAIVAAVRNFQDFIKENWHLFHPIVHRPYTDYIAFGPNKFNYQTFKTAPPGSVLLSVLVGNLEDKIKEHIAVFQHLGQYDLADVLFRLDLYSVNSKMMLRQSMITINRIVTERLSLTPLQLPYIYEV